MGENITARMEGVDYRDHCKDLVKTVKDLNS